MSVTAVDRTAVDGEVREGLARVDARVDDVVELPPLVDLLGERASDPFAEPHRYREGGARSVLAGAPSLRYEFTGPFGAAHSCRVYLPVRWSGARLSVSSVDLGSTLTVSSVASGLARATLGERARARERGGAEVPAGSPLIGSSRYVSNATVLRLSRAVEAARPAVTALFPTLDYDDVVEGLEELSLPYAHAEALAEVLRGEEVHEERSVVAAEVLEGLASGAPAEWVVRRLTAGRAS